MNHVPRPAVTLGFAGLAGIAILLSSCSPTETPPSSVAPDLRFEHIHELVAGPEEGNLLVATHEGLYQLLIEANGSSTAVGPIGGLDFDPMGFTIAGDTAYASGHPGPSTPATFGTPNLGLITSTDRGESWTNVSLTGVTDFHGLTVMTGGKAPARIFGLDPSEPRIQRSLDAGVTWSEGAELVARDILAIGDDLYATTPDGLAVSVDDATTFTLDTAAPKLYLIDADRQGTIAGIDTTGTVWTRGPGREWVQGHIVSGTPQALAIDGARIYVADDRGIVFTDDAGATWVVLEVDW